MGKSYKWDQKIFSVYPLATKRYRDNYDKIFNKKKKPIMIKKIFEKIKWLFSKPAPIEVNEQEVIEMGRCQYCHDKERRTCPYDFNNSWDNCTKIKNIRKKYNSMSRQEKEKWIKIWKNGCF